MDSRIETERLILRPFEVSDAEAAFGWLGDPVVMRFTPTGPDVSIEQTRTRLGGKPNGRTSAFGALQAPATILDSEAPGCSNYDDPHQDPASHVSSPSTAGEMRPKANLGHAYKPNPFASSLSH